MSKEQQVEDFLTYVGYSTLVRNFNIDDMLKTNAKMQAKGLVKNLKRQFLSYINEEDLTFYDNYFFLGEILNRILEIKEEKDKIIESKCMDCKIDDCAISHCHENAKKYDLDKKEKHYKKVVDLCGKRFSGENVSYEEIEEAARTMPDVDLIPIFSKLAHIPATENRYGRVKKIELEHLTRFPELIDEAGVKEALTDRINLPDGKKYYEDLNLVASSLLITRCDYSLAQGNEIVSKFKKWYNERGRDIELSLMSGNLVSKLIKKYNDNLEKENI